MDNRIGMVVAFLALFLGATASFGADTYLLGAEDVVSVSVWERADLSRTVTIRAGGQMTFPPLGEIQAAGRTAGELAREIENQLNQFLRRPTQVTVEILEFHSQSVTVSGAVVTPGRFSFEKIPGLVEVLGVAGGLGPEADLGRVQVFRTLGTQRSTISVDLAAAISGGDLSTLPQLISHDVIFVPTIGGEMGQTSSAAYVTGSVARPGAYGVGTGLDLLKLISLSGGTLPTADLTHVQLIGKDPQGASFVASVDLTRPVESGSAHLLVRPGDIIHVIDRGQTGAGAAWTVTREVLAVSRDILNLFLISDVLNSQ